MTPPGRPGNTNAQKGEEARTCRINARVTPSAFARLKRYAEKKGISIPDAINRWAKSLPGK